MVILFLLTFFTKKEKTSILLDTQTFALHYAGTIPAKNNLVHWII